MQEMSEEKLSILKKKYVALCCAPRVGAIKAIVELINGLDSRVVQYQRGLITTIREIGFKREELERMKITPDMSSKEAEFEKLIKHPDIENIAVDGNNILIFTVPIEIPYGREIYEIGKFIIYLSSDAGAGWVIKYKNLSKLGDSSHPHPHVNSDGTPCLGNIQECLPAMIAAHQYSVAISVAIQYLKSYTKDGGGRPYTDIQNWPTKKKIKPVVHKDVDSI